MKKELKGFMFGVAIATIGFTTVSAAVEQFTLSRADYQVTINGVSYKDSELPLMNYNGRTYAPLNSMLTASGLNVKFVDGRVVVSNSDENTSTKNVVKPTEVPEKTKTPVATAESGAVKNKEEIKKLKLDLDNMAEKYNDDIKSKDINIQRLIEKNEEQNEAERQFVNKEIEKLEIQLENTKNQKNIRQLVKISENEYDFEYVADQSEIEKIESKIQAQYDKISIINNKERYTLEISLYESQKDNIKTNYEREKKLIEDKIKALEK